jgi:hypothetical protein
VFPSLDRSAEAAELARRLGAKTGERPTPFTFAQLSDAHVGFDGPIGTRALEKAVATINGLPRRPDLVLFTGDLTHDTEKPGEHAARMNLFKEISGRLQVAKVYHVPGEHDAGLDGGELFRSVFGPDVVLVRPPGRPFHRPRQRVAGQGPKSGRSSGPGWPGTSPASIPRRRSWSSPTGRCSTSGPTGSGSRPTGTRS